MQEGRSEPHLTSVMYMSRGHMHETCVLRLAAVGGLSLRLTIETRF